MSGKLSYDALHGGLYSYDAEADDWRGRRSLIPMPANTRVAVIGDSIPYGNGFTTSATNTRLYAKGYVNWAAYLGRQRWTFDNTDNFGNPGDTTAQVLARMDAALATSTAGTFILDCLTNDGPNGLTIAQSQANYSTLISKILAAGRICVCITPRPRDITASGLTLSTQQMRDHLARRDWVLGLNNPGNGVYVVDMWRYLADPASTNMAMKSGFAIDGLHPAPLGGYWGGLALAELLGMGRTDGLFQFRDVLVAQNTDVWNAAYTRGCVNSNPLLQGTSSGTATGYTTGGGSGVTVTPTKVNPTGGRTDTQQLVLSGTANANADVYDFYQTISAGNLSIGDVVNVYAEVDYDSLSGYTSHGLIAIDTTTFTDLAGAMVDSSDVNAIAFTLPAAVTGVMRTPTLALQTTILRVGLKGRAINGTAVSGTYRVGAMAVRKSQ